MPLIKQFGSPENWSDFGSLVFEAMVLVYTRLTLDLLVFVTCSLAGRQRVAAAVTVLARIVLAAIVH